MCLHSVIVKKQHCGSLTALYVHIQKTIRRTLTINLLSISYQDNETITLYVIIPTSQRLQRSSQKPQAYGVFPVASFSVWSVNLPINLSPKAAQYGQFNITKTCPNNNKSTIFCRFFLSLLSFTFQRLAFRKLFTIYYILLTVLWPFINVYA